MAPRLRVSAVAAFISVALLACSSSSTGPTGPNPNLAPSKDTTLAGGTLSFKSITIPLGITVTASGALTLIVSGNTQIAGTLTAPCFALSILDSGMVTVTGTVNNGCASPATPAPRLLILAEQGYTVGGQITASGAAFITTDTTITDADFRMVSGHPILPATAPVSAPGGVPASSSARVHASAQQVSPEQGGVLCTFNPTYTADPPSAPAGAAGSPAGSNGQNGSGFTAACSGELDVEGSLSITGQNGGAGGAGTSTSSTPAVGGNGGIGGSLKLRALGNIVFGGMTTLTGGSGGAGGAATATPAAAGASGQATGGTGGANSGGSGYNGPVDIRSKGTITITGSLNIVAGAGGAGGAGAATGAAGAAGSPGQPGGAAIATGGAGGGTLPLGFAATGGVSGLSGVFVTGGNGGAGGKATAAGGNGGAGSTPGAAGGAGGGMTATSGAGGNSQLMDLNGNLIGTGGAAGNLEFDAGIGGAGAAGCPGPGGNGGGGGTTTGALGAPGTGKTAGAAGSTLINTVGNGGNGGNGNGPGLGGPAGTDHAPAPQTATGTNFTPGTPGGGCPTQTQAVQLNNNNVATDPWLVFVYSVDTGKTWTQVTGVGAAYTMNIPTASNAVVILAIARGDTNPTYSITSFEETTSIFVNEGQALVSGIGGDATGVVTAAGSESATPPQQEKVGVDGSGAVLTTASNTATFKTRVNQPVSVSSAIGSVGELPTSESFQISTLTNGQDLTSALAANQVAVGTIPVSLPSLPYQRDFFVGAGFERSLLSGDASASLRRSFDLPNSWKILQTTDRPAPYYVALPASALPSNGLQYFEWKLFTNPNTFAITRMYGTPATLSPTFPTAPYTPPTIALVSGAPYQAFSITGGSLAASYAYGHLSYRAVSGTKSYQLDAYTNYSGYPLNWMTPVVGALGPYAALIGSSGTVIFDATDFDPFASPTNGSAQHRLGFSLNIGTVTTPTLTLGAATVSFNQTACGTTTVPVTANFTGSIDFTTQQTAGTSNSYTVSPTYPTLKVTAGSPVMLPLTFCPTSGAQSGSTAITQLNAGSFAVGTLVSAQTNVSVVIQ